MSKVILKKILTCSFLVAIYILYPKSIFKDQAILQCKGCNSLKSANIYHVNFWTLKNEISFRLPGVLKILSKKPAGHRHKWTTVENAGSLSGTSYKRIYSMIPIAIIPFYILFSFISAILFKESGVLVFLGQNKQLLKLSVFTATMLTVTAALYIAAITYTKKVKQFTNIKRQASKNGRINVDDLALDDSNMMKKILKIAKDMNIMDLGEEYEKQIQNMVDQYDPDKQ